MNSGRLKIEEASLGSAFIILSNVLEVNGRTAFVEFNDAGWKGKPLRHCAAAGHGSDRACWFFGCRARLRFRAISMSSWVVIEHEYKNNFRKRTFLIRTFLFPVFIGYCGKSPPRSVHTVS
jgi:hypothetical protein